MNVIEQQATNQGGIIVPSAESISSQQIKQSNSRLHHIITIIMATKPITVQLFFLVFSSLLLLIFFLCQWLQNKPKIRSVLSEPAMTLIVGIIFSFFCKLFLYEEQQDQFQTQAQAQYNSEETYLAEFVLAFPTRVFFMALLPPILFNSGYQLQRELFFRHLKPILLFSCVGTCLSGLATGLLLYGVTTWGWIEEDFVPSLMELLTFGALIAATDTVSVVGILQSKQVDPHLFSLVFGESALNDAVAIVLFKTLADFMTHHYDEAKSLIMHILLYIGLLLVQAVGSPILGILFSSLMALALKHADMRGHQMLELAVFILPMYIPFILAEVLGLSGMITIFFTGISARRYMKPNVSESTQEIAGKLFKLLSFLAETCIFLELGLSVFGTTNSFRWRFITFAFLAALIGRAFSVYPLSWLFNLSLTRPIVVDQCITCGAVTDESSLATLGVSLQDESVSGSQTTQSFQSVSIAHSKATTISNGSSWIAPRETPRERRDKVIPANFMHMLWFAGLRGAVAYACACHYPDIYGHRDEFIAATTIIVLITIIGMGGATEPLMNYLKIRTGVDENEYMRQWHRQRRLKGRFHRLGK